MYNSEGPQCHWIAHCRLLKDFPGDPAVKTLPANAGDVGLIPSLGTKILHRLEQLSLGTTAAEACVPRAGALQREAAATRSPCTALHHWRTSAHSKGDPAQPKINKSHVERIKRAVKIHKV